MGVGASLYMYVVVVQKFTFAISSPDEFLSVWLTKATAVVIMVALCNRADNYIFMLFLLLFFLT